MKYLHYAFTLIISALLLTGCGIFGDDASDVDKFEPYMIGAFKIVAENEAEYVGTTQSKGSTFTMQDTVTIEQPGQKSLRLWTEEDQLEGQFVMEFVDSTASKDQIDGTLRPRFHNPQSQSGYPVGANGHSVTESDNFLKAEFDMRTNCNHNFTSNNPIIHIVFNYLDSDRQFRTYAIHVNGMIETVDELVCS